MARSLEPKYLTKEHFAAFGRIIQAFVGVETLYAHIIARSLEVKDDTAPLVFSSHSYDALKNLLKVVIGESNLPDSDAKEGLKLVDKVNDKSALRNNIAHNTWKRGKRPDSIKPMVLKTRGSLFMLGTEHNEKDWTVAELNAEADAVLARALAVAQFFANRGIKIGAED